MIIDAVADYLQTNSIATKGNNMFVGDLPFDNNNCLSLVYSPSNDSNSSLKVYDQTIDFFGRFTDSAVGYQKMLSIFNLLRDTKNYDIGGFHVYFSLAVGAINDNDRDVKGRKLFSLSVRFRYRIIAAVS